MTKALVRGLKRALPTPVKERAKDTLHLARELRTTRRFRRSVRDRAALYAGRDLGFGAPRIGDAGLEEAIGDLNRDGFVVLPDAFPAEGLRGVARELETAYAEGRHLPFVRATGETDRPRVLTPEEVARGEDYIASQCNILHLVDPFAACPSARNYVFSDTIIDFAAAVFGCPPAFVAGKVMKSYPNDLPLMDPYLFHCDNQAARILKFFLYLNDVDLDGGPFCYVAGSHRRRFPGWRRKVFWEDAEIERAYGPGSIRPLTGEVGTLIVADTVGFHKATKPRLRSRTLLLITTGVHPFPDRIRMRDQDLRDLSPKQRAMADFVEAV